MGGGPLRLVVEGFPAVRGATMLDKRAWAARRADRLRRGLVLEPRGHEAVCAAVLTEPVSAGADAGVLFMDASGWRALSGHGLVAVTTIALRERLIVPAGGGCRVVFDTPAGRVTVSADGAGFERVTVTHVPSFVLHAGIEIGLPSRHMRADIAFGGAFFAIVDSEEAGVRFGRGFSHELGHRAAEILGALDGAVIVSHPTEPLLAGLDGVIFTGPAGDRADLRQATVWAHGGADRSPGGTGLAAVMAVLDAMGLLGAATVTVEGLLGSTVTGRVASRTEVGGTAALVAEFAGTTWITGRHTFVIDEADPFPEGFRWS